jgi:hypothetical protein
MSHLSLPALSPRDPENLLSRESRQRIHAAYMAAELIKIETLSRLETRYRAEPSLGIGFAEYLNSGTAIAEAVSLGEHLHIDRGVLLSVLSKTAVIPPAMTGKMRKIKDGDYSPEFPLRLMSKDMDLVMDATRASGANLPAASVAQSVLASNLPASGDLDLAAITPFVIGQGTRTEV